MPRKSTVGNLALVGYDDIFKSSSNTLDGERIVQIPLIELFPPDFHPFQVNDDEAMQRLAESVKEHGVREPGIARPRAEGGYELLCGNRRKRACELASLPTMPVIVRELDDDIAVLVMVDSNLEQREKLLPSEKAWAYKIKMEALNHNGKKGEQHSYQIMVEQTGESKNQIFRYIRLTELIIDLLDMIDSKRLSFNPAVELSYLSQKEQIYIVKVITKFDVKPSLSQAKQIKYLKYSNNFNMNQIEDIFIEKKKLLNDKLIDCYKYRCFFPRNFTINQIDEIIISLLSDWKIKNTRP